MAVGLEVNAEKTKNRIRSDQIPDEDDDGDGSRNFCLVVHTPDAADSPRRFHRI
jgi:hypothetical protein